MTKEEFLEKASKEWDKIKETRKNTDSFYDFEKTFDEIWVNLGREALEGSLEDKKSEDRRKKKIIE
jgi:hypothetical protein